uniref:CdiI_2 domain-containing protein n=1 Tax=Globodera pallida TaxID=36090 RepID=A0A183BY88_GLOPA
MSKFGGIESVEAINKDYVDFLCDIVKAGSSSNQTDFMELLNTNLEEKEAALSKSECSSCGVKWLPP